MLKIGVCSKKKIRQLVFFIHYNRFKHVKVSRTKYHMVQCEQKICTGSVTQASRHAETRKRVDIYKSASVDCTRATGAGQAGTEAETRQTVCDPDRQAGRDTKKV